MLGIISLAWKNIDGSLYFEELRYSFLEGDKSLIRDLFAVLHLDYEDLEKITSHLFN